MKKILLFLFLAISIVGMAKVKPMKLRVLYLGGQSDFTHGQMGSDDYFASEADFQKQVNERMEAFGFLLRTYFTTVKVMPAKDWKPEMSDGYDVTIFDGMTPAISVDSVPYVYKGHVNMIPEKHYIPENFSCPSITIGSMGDRLCRSIGIKNDWYCLCLDANAHSMNLNHQIFKGPFKTKLTTYKAPTPEDAKHYSYFQDFNVPDSVLMWRVNTKGYMSDHFFNIGMVSRPWGYLDSPDCEVISSGVCAKTIDAVAIGRHANFMTWGFIGSPLYMTDEAKTVFANAVAYMSHFRMLPLVRKYNERIETRTALKEDMYYVTRKAWKEYEDLNEQFYKSMLDTGKVARERQAKGLKLTAAEKQAVDFTEKDVPPTESYADFLKRHEAALFHIFGEDEGKYQAYFKENTPYFYGGVGSYNIVVDGDAKAWGIPNNDKRLLDKAITCLEKGVETDRANRVLKRYTLCEFTTPQEWRNWYNTYKDKMFFTESGGWYFMVNDPKAPGNDYGVMRKRQAEAVAAAKQSNAAAEEEVSQQTPLVVTATTEKPDLGGVDVLLHVKIQPGFHIYRTVADDDPYIPLKVTFTLPDGAYVGEAYYPVPKPFVKKGTTIYDTDVTIRQNILVQSLPVTIKAKVECQTCNDTMCMPPYEKEFTLNVE